MELNFYNLFAWMYALLALLLVSSVLNLFVSLVTLIKLYGKS